MEASQSSSFSSSIKENQGLSHDFLTDIADVKFSNKKKAAANMEAEAEKADLWDDFVRMLRKLLELCICAVTCGCCRRPSTEEDSTSLYNIPQLVDARLMDEEREAIQQLASFLDKGSKKRNEPIFAEARLKALCILTYSDNVHLERSASIFYAQLTAIEKLPVSELVVEPLVLLLKSGDPAVHRSAATAINNLVLKGHEETRVALVNSGALVPLLQMLRGDNTEVICNTCGCITSLTSCDTAKNAIIAINGIKSIIELAGSEENRIQRNAMGALLNFTHETKHRKELVINGALPIMVKGLFSDDSDIQYYSSAAISNMSVTENDRISIIGIGDMDALRRLIALLPSDNDKVKCQSCLALRNFATDVDSQLLIVRLNALPPLHDIIKMETGRILNAALSCLRNLSVHKKNESSIIAETFLLELRRMVTESSNTTAQAHVAGIIRNLAAGDQVQTMAESGCFEALASVLLARKTNEAVMDEVIAALSVMIDADHYRKKLLSIQNGVAFPRLIAIVASSSSLDLIYNAAGLIAQLGMIDVPVDLLDRHAWALLCALQKMTTVPKSKFSHIALWTAEKFLTYPGFCQKLKDHSLFGVIKMISKSKPKQEIYELSQKIIAKIEAEDSSTSD